MYCMQALSSLIPGAGAAACDLMVALCSWDPEKRPTAAQALQHPFFQVPCAMYILIGLRHLAVMWHAAVAVRRLALGLLVSLA